MLCLEYLRLRLRYGSALRRCGRILLSKEAKLIGNSAQQTASWEQAQGERDAAKDRLRLHSMSCPLCRAIHPE
jgi:hypothetical protein